MPNGHYNIPLKDALTAITLIRKRAKEWKIKKDRVGVMGFSAGGHLAATLGTHFRNKNERPNFMILAYPVISIKNGLVHQGSRDNLLGKKPSTSLVELFSNELHVSEKTPPTFLVHAKDDNVVSIKNSEIFAQALIAKKVPVVLMEYDHGGHGFGMRPKGVDADNWPKALETWMENNHWIQFNR